MLLSACSYLLFLYPQSLSKFPGFLRNKLEVWRRLNLDWLRFSGPLLILSYQQLRQDPAPSLDKLATFLGRPATEEQVRCAAGRPGSFRRKQKERQTLELELDLTAISANYTKQVVAAAIRIQPGFTL